MIVGLNVGESIVTTLKRYGGSVPIEFLARLESCTTNELKEYLDDLERKGVVRQEGETVRLARQSSSPKSFSSSGS